MISTIMVLNVKSSEGRRVRLFFPVIILWILSLALLVAVLPFMLIAAIAASGRGPRLLSIYPAFFCLAFSTSGLLIHVKNKVHIAFY